MINDKVATKRIEELTKLSDEALYAEMHVIPGAPALPRGPGDKAERGKLWFERNRARFRDLVCESDVVKEVIAGTGKGSDVLLICAIADLIATACGLVPPFVVAAMLVRRGLPELCSGES